MHVSFIGPGQGDPAGPDVRPPIPPIRREQFGGVYLSRRLRWRRRLKWAVIIAVLIVVVSVGGGLVAGHLMLRYIQQ